MNPRGSETRTGNNGVNPPEPPGRRKMFGNLQKHFLKTAKMHYLRIIFKRFNKPCVHFSRVWTKNTNCWDILRNFRKFSKNILRKFRKIHYLIIFFEIFNKLCVNFSRGWTKTTTCLEILRKFCKSFMKIQ